VTDVTYALTGDGRCDLLPGGIEQYLAMRRGEPEPTVKPSAARAESASARARRTEKEMARIEGQLAKLEARIAEVHSAMAAAAADHVRAGELNDELNELLERKSTLEEAWLEAADE
jgi:ABC transport system ATP-binding/permease protein